MNNHPRPRRVERKPRGGVKASPKMDPHSITDTSLEGNQARETACFVKSGVNSQISSPLVATFQCLGGGSSNDLFCVFLNISVASVRLRNQWTWRNPNEQTDAQGGVTREHTGKDRHSFVDRKHLRLIVRSPRPHHLESLQKIDEGHTSEGYFNIFFLNLSVYLTLPTRKPKLRRAVLSA